MSAQAEMFRDTGVASFDDCGRTAILFGQSQWSTIANGLRCAADKYAANATELYATAKLGFPGFARVADQFQRQAKEALELANIIEERAGV